MHFSSCIQTQKIRYVVKICKN